MSYFPEDIPFMSEAERKANGIKTAKEIEAQKTQLSEEDATKDATFDCVSRQAVIDWLGNEWDGMVVHAFDGIKNIPSAHCDNCPYPDHIADGGKMDCISRQATITEIKNYERDSTAPIDYVKIVEQMPPAQPDARYINANELIKRLQQAGLDDAVSIAVKMAGHERLKHVPSAQPEPHWIPCSERLPENNCQCIVTAKVKHVDGYPDYEVDTADYTDGIFTTANGWWGIESIIAWMQLPEEYRGEQDEIDNCYQSD